MNVNPDTKRRELDHRHSNGIDVTLSWSPAHELVLRHRPRRGRRSFELVVEAHEALDVFQHPYAHAAFRGLELVHVAA